MLDFFSLTDPNIRYVVIGSVLLTASSAIIGCFTFLRKRALIGDAIAHSVLPGVCLSFILAGTKNPLILLIGAFITGFISVYLMDFITRNSRIKQDTAIGLLLSVFFGIGILLLTFIQHSGDASQSGLDSFLFGKAASLVAEDLMVFGTAGIILIVTIILLYKEFTLISFDENYARTIGLPVRTFEFILTVLTVLAVVIGIQAVGIVLMSAMLITPAAAARFWTNKLSLMIILAAVLGALSGISGAYISYLSPAMPTGPWIVLIISAIAIFSFMAAPGKGIIARLVLQRNHRHQILEENILKVLFHMGEKEKNYFNKWSIQDIIRKRRMASAQLSTGLNRLRNEGYVEKENNTWRLTQEGKEKGQRITRIHRLWEMYLTEYLRIAPDHVHEDAETMEHIITPEIEARLEEQLKYPSKDPHDETIPYRE
ncbi:MAG: metal ABC transporter permease [Cytophagaceae bacterium]|nr:metal ABC transporter permease [Cytophagaceae bacterium]